MDWKLQTDITIQTISVLNGLSKGSAFGKKGKNCNLLKVSAHF